MERKKLYDPENGIMRIAGLMSGSGSNLRKIIEYEDEAKSREGQSPYQVVVIFSDNPSSNAEEIGKEYNIPVIINDLAKFYRDKGKSKKDLKIRAEFDEKTIKELKPFSIDVAAYAGYMSIATEPLINAFLGVNVHPADLSIMSGIERRYTGDHAVRDAIKNGERQLRATTHIVEQKIDYGKILMISSPLIMGLPSSLNLHNDEEVDSAADYWQNRLKEKGDWIIFPKTLENLANGKYSKNKHGDLYFDDKSIPYGVRLKAT